MTPLYTPQEFDDAKSRQRLPLKCEQCGTTFHMKKHYIQGSLKKGNRTGCYCSTNCATNSWRVPRQEVPCAQCGTPVHRLATVLEYESKRGERNVFCSSKCSGTYNSAHKTRGIRRSKLEVWLEQELKTHYPHLDILYNDRTTIKAELDIYIPSLKLAFELNGIFHYEPIYGPERLAAIQNNDQRRFQACLERGIELCILDTSRINYFKLSKVQPFLDIITRLIDDKMVCLPRIELGTSSLGPRCSSG